MPTTQEVKAWELGTTSSRTPRTKTDIHGDMTREMEKRLIKGCIQCKEQNIEHEKFTVGYEKEGSNVISVYRGNVCRTCMSKRRNPLSETTECLSLASMDRRIREIEVDIDVIRKDIETIRNDTSSNSKIVIDMIKALADAEGYFFDKDRKVIKKMN